MTFGQVDIHGGELTPGFVVMCARRVFPRQDGNRYAERPFGDSESEGDHGNSLYSSRETCGSALICETEWGS